MTCDEFRAKHTRDVKFSELPLAVRHELGMHYMSCQACELFVALLKPTDCDMSFDGKELAKKDAQTGDDSKLQGHCKLCQSLFFKKRRRATRCAS